MMRTCLRHKGISLHGNVRYVYGGARVPLKKGWPLPHSGLNGGLFCLSSHVYGYTAQDQTSPPPPLPPSWSPTPTYTAVSSGAALK